MATTIAPSIGAGALFTQGGPGASPGYAAVDLRRAAGGAFQEGVTAAGSWMATQRGAGANMSVDIAANSGGMGAITAYVEGDSVGSQGLYPIPPHPTVINESITSNGTGNPRVDMVVLEVQDNVHDASGQNRAQTRVIAGTATSGATLNNRTGAAALPANCLLLADVLVAAGASSITNSVIRDRRKWARGAYVSILRAVSNYSTASGTLSLVDATNLAPRIECSGVPVRVTLSGVWRAAVATTLLLSPQVDSVGLNGMDSVGGGAGIGITDAKTGNSIFNLTYVFTPSPGSHVIAPGYSAQGSPVILFAESGRPLTWTVEEIFRAATANNSVTTG